MLTADNQRRNYAAFDVTEVSEQYLKCANFNWKANGLLSEGGSGRGSKAHWRQGRDGLARRHRSRTTCRHCAPCTFGATRLLAWSALVHAAKTAGRWITILADVANVTTAALAYMMRALRSMFKADFWNTAGPLGRVFD
jgi:hypothetical protein